MPTVPPVSTTCTGERCDCTSSSRVSSRAAIASAEHAGVRVDDDVARAVMRRSSARPFVQHLAVDLVGVEAAQLLGEALAQLADRQRDPVLGLVGLAQRGGLAVGPVEHDVARTSARAGPA